MKNYMDNILHVLKHCDDMCDKYSYEIMLSSETTEVYDEQACAELIKKHKEYLANTSDNDFQSLNIRIEDSRVTAAVLRRKDSEKKKQ